MTHFSNLSPVGPRSWRIIFFTTKIHTPSHFNTWNRSQTHLHHIPSPPTCKQYWSTPHSPWPTFAQHRYPLHNLTSNVNLLNLTFTVKAHLITQNTPILQLFKNSKTSGIIYTYTPTLGWVTHFSNLSPVGPRSWRIFFSPQKFTHLLTSTPKIGHKHISTTYHPHPHVNSIDQPLTLHDLLSPNIDTLFTISLQMSICSISHSLKKHT